MQVSEHQAALVVDFVRRRFTEWVASLTDRSLSSVESWIPEKKRNTFFMARSRV